LDVWPQYRNEPYRVVCIDKTLKKLRKSIQCPGEELGRKLQGIQCIAGAAGKITRWITPCIALAQIAFSAEGVVGNARWLPRESADDRVRLA
jgi:hypothetical protein